MAAHSCGRVAEWLRPAPPAPADDFLTGSSGTVGGRRAAIRGLADRVLDVAWRRGPRGGDARTVLVVGIERPGSLMPALLDELRRSRHNVTVRVGPPGARGKFENLNALLAAEDLSAYDWLLVVDDDVEAPRGFLDRFLGAAERYGFALAQPAHRLASHAAWPVTRRRPLSVARETAFARETFDALLPFPDLRMGWGLDVHWAALARDRGWRIGVVDATPIRHTVKAAKAYDARPAIEEARAFLATHPYLPRDEADRTLRTFR